MRDALSGSEYSVIEDSGETAAKYYLRFGEGKFCTVLADGENFLRVEVDSNKWNTFSRGIMWCDHLCLGIGDEIIVVDLKTFVHRIYKADMYFGSFFENGELLFAASGTGVLAFNAEMELLWRNEDLAVDGVCFGGVCGNVLAISCEMDPPGGWHEKRLDIRTGKELKEKGDSEDHNSQRWA